MCHIRQLKVYESGKPTEFLPLPLLQLQLQLQLIIHVELLDGQTLLTVFPDVTKLYILLCHHTYQQIS